MKKRSKTTLPKSGQAAPSAVPSAEVIRRRAHEIYLARGVAPGDEVQDWLQAERELRERKDGLG